MLAKDTPIKIKNRDNGTVGYTIPDMNNMNRLFQKNEEKEIPMEELRKLNWIPGGKYLLENCFIIENKEAIEELVGDTEPEYFYSDDDIKTLLLEGSCDQLLDALDFAPAGVINLIKDYAVKLKLNDVSKREAILKKTGFNVTAAIQHNEESGVEEQEKGTKRRRSTPAETAERRASAPKRRITIKE
jgi:hypothetical protein